MRTQRLPTLLVGMALLVAGVVVGLSILTSGDPPAHASTVGVPPPTHGVMHTISKAPLSSLPASQIGVPMMTIIPGVDRATQIKTFLESHPFAGGDVIGGGFPHVMKITFLTVADYRAQYGLGLSLPDTELLAVINMKGPFHITHANAPPSEAAKIAAVPAPEGREVIDVATGNLEVWSL